jgi:uncharacterized protein (TIGR02452 family)
MNPNTRDKVADKATNKAANKATNVEAEKLLELHLRRVERIFQVAAENGAEVLILGAFGCGAFCNPPEIVAKAFKAIQKKYETYFDVIEYAVFCGRHETANYDTFEETFGQK